MRETIDTTYADLRPSDLVIDKAGKAWPIAQLIHETEEETGFWLCDPVTQVKTYFIRKNAEDPVTVSRVPSQADEASKLEAEFPETAFEMVERKSEETRVEVERIKEMAEAVAAVGWTEESIEAGVATIKEVLGGTVEAEVTAAEVDAAAAATDDAPLTIIPFADMTPLEARSHLYLLHHDPQQSHLFMMHGVYVHDIESRAELSALHDQAHAATAAGTLNSRHVPHVHQEA
jgi:hypothetical protein